MFLADVTPLAAVSLAIGACAAVFVPYFLLVDARLSLRPLVESGRLDRLLVAAANTRHPGPRHARSSRFNVLKGAVSR